MKEMILIYIFIFKILQREYNDRENAVILQVYLFIYLDF
jgi:hypothetical protein